MPGGLFKGNARGLKDTLLTNLTITGQIFLTPFSKSHQIPDTLS